MSSCCSFKDFCSIHYAFTSYSISPLVFFSFVISFSYLFPSFKRRVFFFFFFFFFFVFFFFFFFFFVSLSFYWSPEKIGDIDPNDQIILVNWYNSLTSKGSLVWITLTDLCGQPGVSFYNSIPRRVKELYFLFLFLFFFPFISFFFFIFLWINL